MAISTRMPRNPVSFDRRAPLEPQAKFGEKLNGGIQVFHHDADIVHAFDRHAVSLGSGGPTFIGCGRADAHEIAAGVPRPRSSAAAGHATS
jgi:hypothetical protein